MSHIPGIETLRKAARVEAGLATAAAAGSSAPRPHDDTAPDGAETDAGL
jgi:hypothetical protein